MKHFVLLICFLSPVLVFAQVTGRIVNENNNGVPFASITVKSTSAGTATDSAGHFSISVKRIITNNCYQQVVMQVIMPQCLVTPGLGVSPCVILCNGSTKSIVL